MKKLLVKLSFHILNLDRNNEFITDSCCEPSLLAFSFPTGNLNNGALQSNNISHQNILKTFNSANNQPVTTKQTNRLMNQREAGRALKPQAHASSYTRLKNGIRVGGQTLTGRHTPNQNSQKSLPQHSQSYKRIQGRQGQLSGQTSQMKEQKSAAPLSTLSLSSYNNKPLPTPPRATKGKPSVFPTRVSSTLMNIQPIRKRVKEHQPASSNRFGSNKHSNSQIFKKPSERQPLCAADKSPAIDIKNCKENGGNNNSRPKWNQNFSKIKAMHEGTGRTGRNDTDKMKHTVVKKVLYNQDLTLTSMEESEQHAETMVTQSRDILDKETRASLDMEIPHGDHLHSRSTNNQYKQKSRQSSYTEDADAYCVDDDEEEEEEDDDDDDDPADFERYTKNTMDAEIYEVTMDSRKVDQAFDAPKEDTFFSAHDSQRTIMQQDSQLPMQAISQDDQCYYQDTLEGYTEIKKDRVTQITQDMSQLVQRYRTHESQASFEETFSRNKVMKSIGTAEDVVTVKKNSEVSFRNEKSAHKTEVKSRKGNQDMPRTMIEDKNSTSYLESSTIKTNQTPIKYQDKNFLLPMRSSDKKEPMIKVLSRPSNSQTRQRKEEGPALASEPRKPMSFYPSKTSLNNTGEQMKAVFYPKEAAEDQNASRFSLRPDAMPNPHTVSTRSVPVGQDRIPLSQGGQSTLRQTQDQACQTPHGNTNDAESRQAVHSFKKYEQTLQLPYKGRKATSTEKQADAMNALLISVDHGRKSADPQTTTKLNSTLGTRSAKSAFSSQLSKGTSKRAAGDSPFQAVLAHQQRSCLFSFPKGKRGLLQVEGQRTSQRDLQRERKRPDERYSQLDGLFEFKNYNSNLSGGNQRGAKKGTGAAGGGRSPRFNEARYPRKRASISSVQDAQRKSADLEEHAENGRSAQASSASKKPSNTRNDPKVPLTSHKQISSVPTQESMKSLGVLQSNAQIRLPAPQPLLSRQVEEIAVTGIDSGEQKVNFTEEGSLDDTHKRLQIFNQTTNLQDSGASLRRFDCKASQMFNSASEQTSASAVQRRLAGVSPDQSAGKQLTLRQLAEQAMANADEHDQPRRSRIENRANSHTSGTATYYVDDVSSSPNKGNSLTQTEQKVHLTFSNTNHMNHGGGYSLLGQLASKGQGGRLTEDRGVCNFEVTLQTQQQELVLAPGQEEKGECVPQPATLACLPHSQNKEFARVQQRIQQQEQHILQRQMEFDQQNKEFKGQLEAQRMRQHKGQYQSRSTHHRSVQPAKSASEGHLMSVHTYDDNSCEKTTQYNQTNSNSLQTAKFNEQLHHGSIQSCQDASQWLAENTNFYGGQDVRELCYQDEETSERAPRMIISQQLPFSPGPHEYTTAAGFDDRIDLIGHGEIRNMESTRNAESSALSNSLPFQSQNLTQLFRDMKNPAGVQVVTQPPQPGVHVRSDEEIIQEAINSIAPHLPASQEAAMGAAVPNVVVGQQCMNYNDYLKHLQNKRGRGSNTRGSKRHSPKSSGIESVKRSSASSQHRSMSEKRHGSQQRKKEYAPVLRNESRMPSGVSRVSSKMQTKKAPLVSKQTPLPRWNMSTNALSAAHRRIKSQAQKSASRKAADQAQPQQQVKTTHHIVCRSISGQRGRTEKQTDSYQSRKEPTWSQKKKDSKNRAQRSAHRGSSQSSTKARRRRSNSKKAKSGDFWQPGQLVSRAPEGSQELGNDLESQTLEMSYMNRETRQAQQEEEQDPEQAKEVAEMFNGRKQVYVNLDRGRMGDSQGPLEIPLSTDSLTYYEKPEEQFQSMDFINCHGHPPLTIESKASQGVLQRQLIESFNDPHNIMHHSTVLRNDSLDLRAAPECNQMLQFGQIREFNEASVDQRAQSQDSPSQLERGKDTTPSEYHDFVRLNHLNYPEHAYLDGGGSDKLGDLYDCQFGVIQQQVSGHALQNPQVLQMLQKVNERNAILDDQAREEEGRPDMGYVIQEEQTEEGAQETEDRPRSASASRTTLSRNQAQENIDGDVGSRGQRKGKSRTRELSATKVDLNPLASTLDDYVKVVQRRVNSRRRRCSSTDYQKRFLGHTNYRPPAQRNSSMSRSHQSFTQIGKRRDGSRNFNNRRSASNNNRDASLEKYDVMEQSDQSLGRGRFHSELQEKQHLQSLKVHLVRQKQHERQLLERHNVIKKQQIMQTKKQVGLIQNKNQLVFDKTQKKKKTAEKVVAEHKIIVTKMAGEAKAIEAVQQDLGELGRLRETLRSEMEMEAQLVEDIRSITHKYKRLVAEQTREKEKLAQAVRGQQQKIMRNLRERRQVLRQDNEKLFSEFKSTMSNGSHQEQRQPGSTGRPSRANSKTSNVRKKSQSLSRKSSKNKMSSRQMVESRKQRTSASRLPPSFVR